jgi:hypothetical protein
MSLLNDTILITFFGHRDSARILPLLNLGVTISKCETASVTMLD